MKKVLAICRKLKPNRNVIFKLIVIITSVAVLLTSFLPLLLTIR